MKGQHYSTMENSLSIEGVIPSPTYIFFGSSLAKEEFFTPALDGSNELFEQRIGMVEGQTRVVYVLYPNSATITRTVVVRDHS